MLSFQVLPKPISTQHIGITHTTKYLPYHDHPFDKKVANYIKKILD
jgi:hypothetical protein